MSVEERPGMEQAPKKLKPIPLQGDVPNLLVRKFASLSVADKPQSSSGADVSSSRGSTEKISPSDFVALQRLRSSALACRTSTTIKSSRNGGILFDDLRNSDASWKAKVSFS